MKDKTERIWKELYSYESLIYGFLKNSLGDGDIARDLYQDVYLNALKNIKSLDESRSLKNWIFTITRNRLINYFRLHKRREYQEIHDDVIYNQIVEDNIQDTISEILDLLPDRQKRILLLREIEGLSYTELSEIMGMSQSAATSLLKRSRENFEKHYLLKFLPEWIAQVGESIGLNDLFRFINPFDPPLDLLKLIEGKRSNYFSKIKASWDQVRANFINENDLKEILNKIQIKPFMKVIDIGCGTGFVSIQLSLFRLKVIALDIQKEMIQELHSNKTSLRLFQMNIIQADVRDLPLRKYSVDLIFFVLVLHHLTDPIKILQNSLSLLKKKGIIVLVDFLKHRQKEYADAMSDLWLGFQPDVFKKFADSAGLVLLHEGKFERNKKLKSFYQIWQKNN